MSDPLIIPSQLHNWRFILLGKFRKIPIGNMKGWPENRETLTYKHDSPILRTHLAQGGNYGVVADKDRFVIACDSKEIEAAIETNLTPTFSVRSPKHKLKHFYYHGEITHQINCTPTPEGDPCADIRYGNSYVVGPGCTYKDKDTGILYGNYNVVDDRPVATVREETVIKAIQSFIKNIKNNEPVKISETPRKGNNDLDFAITKLIDISTFSTNGSEHFGVHPSHGSTTGSNFHFNTNKNTWHCFRCNSGGGPLQLLAVIEGIIQCEEAGKGCLVNKEKFKAVLAKAEERGLIDKMRPNAAVTGEIWEWMRKHGY